MMMMPFVRLLAIYALVGAAIFAFLKRDELAAYFATPEAEAATPSAAAAPEASPTQTLDAPLQAEATEAEAPAAEPATYSAPPAFGSAITPQYFGQAAAPAPAPAPQGESMVSRWTKARAVFSSGKVADAAQLYESLTADFPRNADLHGEAGNLYYNLGQFGKAATHFYAVGEISAQNGNAAMAQSMLGLLRRISPNKAADLQRAIAASR